MTDDESLPERSYIFAAPPDPDVLDAHLDAWRRMGEWVEGLADAGVLRHLDEPPQGRIATAVGHASGDRFARLIDSGDAKLGLGDWEWVDDDGRTFFAIIDDPWVAEVWRLRPLPRVPFKRNKRRYGR